MTERIVKSWITNHGDTVEIFVGKGGEHFWRAQAPNGEKVGGGEGHPELGDAVAAARRHHPPVASEA